MMASGSVYGKVLPPPFFPPFVPDPLADPLVRVVHVPLESENGGIGPLPVLASFESASKIAELFTACWAINALMSESCVAGAGAGLGGVGLVVPVKTVAGCV